MRGCRRGLGWEEDRQLPKCVGKFFASPFSANRLAPSCSHQRRRPLCAIEFADAHPDAEDIDGSALVHPDEALGPGTVEPAPRAVQHHFRGRERCRKEYELVQSLLLAHPERAPRTHRGVRHLPVRLQQQMRGNDAETTAAYRSGAVEQLRVHVRNLSMLGMNGAADSKGRVELYEKGYGKDAAGIAKEAITYGE